MTLKEFQEEITKSNGSFAINIENIGAYKNEMSFPKWYEMFGRWLEVGTEMESEYWDEDEDVIKK